MLKGWGTATIDGFPLADQTRSLKLAAPREGIVRHVDVSGSKHGAPLAAGDLLPAGTREAWVRFHFAVLPKTTCGRKVCKPPIRAKTALVQIGY